MNSLLRWVGLVAAICGALVGQSHLIGEPWQHYMIITGIVAATTFAYFQQPPRNINSQDRVSDTELTQINKDNK